MSCLYFSLYVCVCVWRKLSAVVWVYLTGLTDISTSAAVIANANQIEIPKYFIISLSQYHSLALSLFLMNWELTPNKSCQIKIKAALLATKGNSDMYDIERVWEREGDRCIAYRMTKLAHNNGKCKCLFTAFVYVFPQLFLISDLKNILDKSKHGAPFSSSPPPLAPSVKVAASIKKKRTESASFVCQRKATTTKAITATTTNNNTSNDYNTYACACVRVCFCIYCAQFG